MFEIDIEREFSAAHCLKGYNGDCSALHGHNWKVQVFVLSEKLDKIGIACDFRTLKKELDSILDEFDHKNLSELDCFQQSNPTSEVIARIIFKKIKDKLDDGKISVSKVRVCESPGSGASYFERKQ
jgi:6-pyruvoyltetrahydropterin/6-carboxytetrahydropterin synthase